MKSLIKVTIAGIAAMQAGNAIAQFESNAALLYLQSPISGAEVTFHEEISGRFDIEGLIASPVKEVLASDSNAKNPSEVVLRVIERKRVYDSAIMQDNLNDLMADAVGIPGSVFQEAAFSGAGDLSAGSLSGSGAYIDHDADGNAAEVFFLEEGESLTAAIPKRLTPESSDPTAGLANRQAKVGIVKQENIEGRKVLLTNIEFEDNTVIDSDTLSRIAVPFVGRPIGLSELEDLRIRLTRAYIEQGYLNSGAVLPDQKVENGNIVYKLVEGSLAGINIVGAGDLKEKYISERVLNGAAEPFNSKVLQENFQLLLDDPLIERMDGQLESLPEPGKSLLNLKVTRARPNSFTITGSNHGAVSLGEQQFDVESIFRNITGRGDALGITVGGNQNKYNVTTVYEVPLDIKETRVKLTLTAADSSVVEEPLDSLDIESSTIGGELTVSRALKRSVNKVITTGTTISIRQNSNTVGGEDFSFANGEEDGRSRVTVSRVWYDWLRRGEKDVLAARATGNVGLDMFGSTAHDDSRPDSEFISAQGQVQYARRFLDDRGQMILRLDGQLASRELLPLERFSLGGAATVRGYRENSLVRDRGVLGTAEFRYRFYRSPEFGSFQVAPFLDLGYGSNKTFFKADEKLASAGLGILWSLKSKFFGELYFGSSLIDSDDPENSTLQDKGVHLKLVAEF